MGALLPMSGILLVVDEPLRIEETIVCQTRLDGVVKHDERLAACQSLL